MNKSVPSKTNAEETDDRPPHTDFDGAFTPGTVFIEDDQEYEIETTKWGTLVVSSGRIIAADAVGPGYYKPFKKTVPPGKYPVILSWNGSETCALQVLFSRRKVARWEPAWRIGEKPIKKKGSDPPCFGVDSGMAGLFDAKAAKLADKNDAWHETFSSLYQTKHSIEIDPKTGAGMVWCHAGYGDGAYPCFWGFDRSDNIVCLIMDFFVLVEPIYKKHIITDLYTKKNSVLNDPWFSQFDCTDIRIKWAKKRNEFRFEYRSPSNLFEIELFDGKGNSVWEGGQSGGRGAVGDPKCIHYMKRTFDLSKDKQAQLELKHIAGIRALSRKPK